ncbi:MAG: hypothetical protein OEY50_06060, partial [Nitrospinota bacterium]|nr:hypothetical protein [Nitrospinota bacterium]
MPEPKGGRTDADLLSKPLAVEEPKKERAKKREKILAESVAVAEREEETSPVGKDDKTKSQAPKIVTGNTVGSMVVDDQHAYAPQSDEKVSADKVKPKSKILPGLSTEFLHKGHTSSG